MSDRLFPRVTISSIQVQREPEGREKNRRTVAQFFPSSGLENALEKAEDMIQGNDNYILVYHLNVFGITKDGAAVTARAFVRAKNITEPSFVRVTNVTQTTGSIKISSPPSESELRNAYKGGTFSVTVQIDK